VTRWNAFDLAIVATRLRQSIGRPLDISGDEVIDRRRAKYRNTICEWQGQRFDSKLECQRFREFELQRIAGGIRAVIRQVSMPLPGSSHRIRIDFLVIENDGTHRYFDAKGFMTPAWSLKRDQVKTAYGIHIQLI
jgi:hypothetical protein